MNCSSLINYILFADETNLFHSDTCVTRLQLTLNSELEKLSQWFRANKLSLNLGKTSNMVFGSKGRICTSSNFILKIDGKELKRVVSTKFLGVHVDCFLNWKSHINQLSLKVSQLLGIINRVKHILSCNLRKMLYTTLILPYFSYCNILWGGASKFASSRLVVLQKRAIRLISNTHYLAHTNPLFNRFQLLKLNDIYTFQLLVFMYPTKHDLLPSACT